MPASFYILNIWDMAFETIDAEKLDVRGRPFDAFSRYPQSTYLGDSRDCDLCLENAKRGDFVSNRIGAVLKELTAREPDFSNILLAAVTGKPSCAERCHKLQDVVRYKALFASFTGALADRLTAFVDGVLVPTNDDGRGDGLSFDE